MYLPWDLGSGIRDYSILLYFHRYTSSYSGAQYVRFVFYDVSINRSILISLVSHQASIQTQMQTQRHNLKVH